MKKLPDVEFSFYMSPESIRISGKYAEEFAEIAGVNPSTDSRGTLQILSTAADFFLKLRDAYRAKIVPK